MASAADQTLEILIRTTADPSGAAATTTALKEIQTQGMATAAALTGSWEQVALATGKSVASLKALGAARVEAAASGMAGETAVTELTAQQVALQAELQTLAGTRLALTRAQIEGNTAEAAILADELKIRTSTLGVMRSETLDQAALNSLLAEENALLAIAGKETEGVTAGGLLAGVNFSKARQEALVLAREMAVGNVRASTTGSLLGSFGPALTVAGIAGFILFETFKKINDEAEKFNKDLADLDTKLDKQMEKWRELAILAKDSRDVRGLSGDFGAAIDELQTKLFDVQQHQVTGWHHAIDWLGSEMQRTLYGVADGSAEYFKQAWQKSVDAIANRLTQTLTVARDALTKAQSSVAQAEQLRGASPATAVVFYESELIGLKKEEVGLTQELNSLDLTSNEGRERAAQIFDRIHSIDREIVSDESEKNKAAQRFGEITKENALLLQTIRDNQKLINDQPFAGIDAKQVALHQSYIQEEQQLAAAIQQTKQAEDAAQGAGAQAQVEALRAKLHALTTEYVELQFKIQTSAFGGELQADLIKWVNSFGTAAHQVASIITGTLNTAISGTSQALTGLIFGTTTWQQAFSQAAQSIVGEIIKIGIQFVVSRLFMSAINRAAGTADALAATAQAAPVAAAWSSAATSASIATYGVADVEGVAAYVAALASGKAAAIASAGFQTGGFTGSGNENAIAGVVHGQEFVFAADETAALGVPFLQKLAAAAGGTATFPRGYQEGGWVEPSGYPAGGGSSFGSEWVWVPAGGGGWTVMQVPAGTGGITAGGFPGMMPGTDPFAGFTGGSYVNPFSGFTMGVYVDPSTGAMYDASTGASITITPMGSVGGTPVQIFTDPFGSVTGTAGATYYVDPSTGSVVATPGGGYSPLSQGSTGQPGGIPIVQSTIVDPSTGRISVFNPLTGGYTQVSGSGGWSTTGFGAGSAFGAGWAGTGGAGFGGYGGLGGSGAPQFWSGSAGVDTSTTAGLSHGGVDPTGTSSPGALLHPMTVASESASGAQYDAKLASYYAKLAPAAALAGMSVEDYASALATVDAASQAAALASVGMPTGFSWVKDPWAGINVSTHAGSWQATWTPAQQAQLRSILGPTWKTWFPAGATPPIGSPMGGATSVPFTASTTTPYSWTGDKGVQPIGGPSGIMTPGVSPSSGSQGFPVVYGQPGGPISFRPPKRHSGGLLSDEMHVIGQLGEFMVQTDAVDHYGVDFMRALNDRQISIPSIGRRHQGGNVGDRYTWTSHDPPADALPPIEVHVYHDFDTWARKREESSDYRRRFVRSRR